MQPAAPTDVPIELRSWRQFVVLAETLHFGRAASHLHMTQPPLTQAIQHLERRLGTTLFERSRRSVALTPAGQALLAPARELLRQAAALPGVARAAAQGEVGRLRLGFVSTFGFGPLPGWLRHLRDEHPGLEVVLQEATGDVQLLALERGELDAGVLLHAPGMAPTATSVRGRALERLSLGEEPLVLALPQASRLASGPAPSLGDVMAEPLVIFPREIAPSLFDALLAHYHAHDVAPSIAQQAIQMQTIVNLVSSGLGIAWVPESVTRLQRPGVVYRAPPGAPAAATPRGETTLVWTEPGPPAVRRVVEHARRHLAG